MTAAMTAANEILAPHEIPASGVAADFAAALAAQVPVSVNDIDPDHTGSWHLAARLGVHPDPVLPGASAVRVHRLQGDAA